MPDNNDEKLCLEKHRADNIINTNKKLKRKERSITSNTFMIAVAKACLII